jgi:ectoine hydroxylase-related dioxygenase (phytanoyl-CoA dioxygenase family)
MGKVLSDEAVAQFQSGGFICPVDVLSPDEVAQVRRDLSDLEDRLGARLRRVDHCHLFFRWAYDLVRHPRVGDAVEDVLGPDVFVHSSRVFSKPARDPAFVTWHQDGLYSHLNTTPALSAWIALSESTPANGCVRVVAGTHREARRPHRETFGADNLLNHGEEVCDAIDPARVRDLVLSPGQMSIHHVNLIHGSEPNRSDTPRIGFAVSYITPAAGRTKLPVLRVRGEATPPDFDLVEGPPDYRDADAAIEARSAFVRRRGLQPLKLAGMMPRGEAP